MATTRERPVRVHLACARARRSISGMLYVDEATKNDSYDAGDETLKPKGVTLALVGRGVNDQKGKSLPNGSAKRTLTGRDGAFTAVVPAGHG